MGARVIAVEVVGAPGRAGVWNVNHVWGTDAGESRERLGVAVASDGKFVLRTRRREECRLDSLQAVGKMARTLFRPKG